MTALELANWRRLRVGAAGTVLAVDFGPRTGQPGFVRLAAVLDADVSLYETLPPKPAGDFDRSANPERYLAHWLGAVMRACPKIEAVLAFCAGGGFAGALGAAAESTRVVLINPSLVTVEGMLAEFDQAIAQLGARLQAQEVAQARAAASGRPSLEDTGEALIAAYRKLVEVAFAREGIGPRFADNLVERFAAYLCYLLAASRCAGQTPPFDAMVIASPEHPVPPRFEAGCRRIGTRFEESLGDPAVAAMVTQRLREG